MKASIKLQAVMIDEYLSNLRSSEREEFDFETAFDLFEDQIEELFYELLNDGDKHYGFQDVICEFREGVVQDLDGQMGLKRQWSRHYESYGVAAEVNGEWIAWTYWYGGGKHGNPEAIEWWEDAYYVDYEEEEVMMLQRKFTERKTDA